MTTEEARRVVVVTGAAQGIGAGIAEALGKTGAFVVTLDANLSLDGSATAAPEGTSTADRIVAAGGAAREAVMSVTDADAVRDLFEGLVADHGSLDAVVNVAGISRPTSFADGSAEDWNAVLQVHLEGYLTVLRAALPIMAAAGHGRIVGVTSGSGWRPADTGAYGCAKRAVASLTWQLGANPPPGVTINALSPIAATRMVAAASLQQSSAGDDSAQKATTGGISLTGFPSPDKLGPIGAHLASEEFSWCSGRVLFSAGAEVAHVARPALLEVIRSRPARSLPTTLATVVPQALVPAEAGQTTGGGATARFVDSFDAAGDEGFVTAPTGSTCLVVSDVATGESGLLEALRARGVECVAHKIESSGFDEARQVLGRAAADLAHLDSVVLAVGFTEGEGGDAHSWQDVLDDHAGVPERILADAAWMRAVADHSATTGRPVRFVGLVGASTPGGLSRAQAATQLSRAALGATDDRVSAVVVSCESPEPADLSAAADLAAHLVVGPDTDALSGAELCTGRGWIGLRSHPAPAGTVNYGGPSVPDWLDGALRALLGGSVPPPP